MENEAEIVSELMTDIEAVTKEAGQGMSIDFTETVLGEANKIIDTYGDVYRQWKELTLAADQTGFVHTFDDGSQRIQTMSEWIDDLENSVTNLNDAILSSDTQKIEEARTEYLNMADAL